MEYISFLLRFVSPAFLSGANQSDVELRTASIKGQLRWWWRAACGDPTWSVSQLSKREGALFGSAELKLKSPFSIAASFEGQSRAIKRGSSAPSSGRKEKIKDWDVDLLHYIGYAVIRIPSREEREQAEMGRDPALWDQEARKAIRYPVFIRPALAEGTTFRLTLSWPKGRLDPEQTDSLLRSLAAWVTFGGLGSRSRKGFGALELEETSLRASAQQLGDEARRALREMRAKLDRREEGARDLISLPSWPVLRELRVLERGRGGNWREALGEAARCYRRFRPKKAASWIAGSASPRRASSVFITLKKEKNWIGWWIFALPSSFGAKPDSNDLKVWKAFLGRVASF